jgi:hypothetical protein
VTSSRPIGTEEILRFDEKLHAEGVLLPINRTRPVAARTDVENGYLQRADNIDRSSVTASQDVE